jgi:hypothetical protein
MEKQQVAITNEVHVCAWADLAHFLGAKAMSLASHDGWGWWQFFD